MNAPRMPRRGGSEQVKLVLENGQARPVIGTSEPADEEARLRVARYWGVPASPRQQAQGGITEPLPLRSRTVLSHCLPQAERDMLQRGLTGTGKVPESGVVASAPVDPPRED
jgi:hypothetical protein